MVALFNQADHIIFVIRYYLMISKRILQVLSLILAFFLISLAIGVPLSLLGLNAYSDISYEEMVRHNQQVAKNYHQLSVAVEGIVNKSLEIDKQTTEFLLETSTVLEMHKAYLNRVRLQVNGDQVVYAKRGGRWKKSYP